MRLYPRQILYRRTEIDDFSGQKQPVSPRKQHRTGSFAIYFEPRMVRNVLMGYIDVAKGSVLVLHRGFTVMEAVRETRTTRMRPMK